MALDVGESVRFLCGGVTRNAQVTSMKSILGLSRGPDPSQNLTLHTISLSNFASCVWNVGVGIEGERLQLTNLRK